SGRKAVCPRLTVLVPSHNQPDLLARCLRSVTRWMPSSSELLVVDDGSAEGRVSAVARTFPGATVHRRERPGGFCVAVNEGVALARGEVLELLTPHALAPSRSAHAP